MTLDKFIENSGLDPSMVRAMIRRLGGWTEAQETMRDIAEHGAMAGFSGFIYYNETLSFFKAHKRAILAMVAEMADQCGQGMLETVQGFNCLGKEYSLDEIGEAIYSGQGKSADTIRNALAWFALEEVANRYENMKEEE